MEKFKNIGIVGLGLLGGSLAFEIKKRNISQRITGFSRRKETLEKAISEKLIDEYFLNFDEGIKDIDFLILATPIKIVSEYFLKIGKQKTSFLITDVASVKKKIVEDATRFLGKDNNFVPSHPMAGSEKSGIEAKKEDLFEGKNVIITPTKDTKKENLLKVNSFWESLGAKTILLSPAEHDYFIGLTSHLPHILVYALLSLFEKNDKKDILFRCAGTGFFDTTRIGKSNSQLWADIFLANRENLFLWIEEFEKALNEMKHLLKDASYEVLNLKLNNIKRLREEADEKN